MILKPRAREGGVVRATEGMSLWLASHEAHKALKLEAGYPCAHLSKQLVFFILSVTPTPQLPTVPPHERLP